MAGTRRGTTRETMNRIWVAYLRLFLRPARVEFLIEWLIVKSDRFAERLIDVRESNRIQERSDLNSDKKRKRRTTATATTGIPETVRCKEKDRRRGSGEKWCRKSWDAISRGQANPLRGDLPRSPGDDWLWMLDPWRFLSKLLLLQIAKTTAHFTFLNRAPVVSFFKVNSRVSA